MIGCIIGFVIIVAIFFFFVRKALVEKKHRRFVEENSRALKSLDTLNRLYVFEEAKPLNVKHDYDNEAVFETISCEDYLIYLIQSNPEFQSEILNRIKEANENNRLKKEDRKKVEEISSFGDYKITPDKKLKTSRLLEIEKRQFASRVKTNTTTFFGCTVWLYHCSMRGTVRNYKVDYFGGKSVLALIERIHNKSGRFFNDQEIWDAICRVERGKVSNRLRFSIYERDGNRCKICGRGKDVVNLEIDHIVPISKGGKSTPENLQTLCHDCNVKKGNRV